MQNAMANGVWKKALKQLVVSVTSVLLVNFSDPKGVTWSKEWLIHVGLAILTLTVFNEAQYWNNWARNGNGKPPGGTQ